jgi:hypothetical protein
MPYPGYLGTRERAHGIKRVRLLSGEAWMKGEATAGKPADPGTVLYDSGLRRPTWARSTKVAIETQNQYGYTSASAAKFPEAFKPVDTKFWQPLSQEETLDVHLRQAQANLKATFDEDSAKLALGSTAADAEYANAQGQRNSLLRRRKLLSRPATWEEKKRREEELRKLPLARKYATGEAAFRESSAIVQSGPLDTPILVSGLPTVIKGDPGAAPAKLKLKRNKRGQTAAQSASESHVEISLPSFNPNNAPQARLIGPTRNGWNLPSRSEMMYPEAYRDLSTVYWKQLTSQERLQVDTVQARAMEKAGYERGTQKHFIEEIEPDSGYVFKGAGRMDDTNREGSGWSAEAVIGLIVILGALAVLCWYGWQASDGAALPGIDMPQPRTDLPDLERD